MLRWKLISCPNGNILKIGDFNYFFKKEKSLEKQIYDYPQDLFEDILLGYKKLQAVKGVDIIKKTLIRTPHGDIIKISRKINNIIKVYYVIRNEASKVFVQFNTLEEATKTLVEINELNRPTSTPTYGF